MRSLATTLTVAASIGSVCELPPVTRFFNGNPNLGLVSGGIAGYLWYKEISANKKASSGNAVTVVPVLGPDVVGRTIQVALDLACAKGSHADERRDELLSLAAMLFSEREFKKQRLRYFLPELERWWDARAGGRGPDAGTPQKPDAPGDERARA